MKKLLVLFVIIFSVFPLVFAAPFTPQGDIRLRGIYNITNAPFINSTNLNVTETIFVAGVNVSTGIGFVQNDSFLFNTGDTATGNYTFDVTTFFIDALKNFIGIGTATPTNLLNVLGDANVTGTLFVREQNVSRGIAPVFNDSFLFNTGDTATGNYTFDTNTFFIDSSSNQIGIGTTTLDGTLHVFTASAGSIGSTSSADDLTVENNADAGITILTPDASISALNLGSPNRQTGAFLRWKNTDGLFDIGTGDTSAEIAFSTDLSIERMRIDSSGNVGINTTTPQNTLNVIGTFNVTNNTGTLGVSVNSNGQLLGSFGGTASTPSYSFVGDENTGMSTSGNKIGWSVGGVQRFVFSSGFIITEGDTGSFGLKYAEGTESGPTYTFQSDRDTGMFRATTDELAFSTAGSERIRIDNNGNVGINTTNPDRLLHLLSSSGAFVFKAGSATVFTEISGNKIRQTGSNLQIDATTTNLDIELQTEGQNRLVIDGSNNGFVGIGTSTPAERLEVAGNILLTDNNKSLYGTASDASILYDGSNLVIDPKEVGSGILLISGTTNVSSANNFTVDVNTLHVAGNTNRVGIGTTSPAVDLHIVGAGDVLRIDGGSPFGTMTFREGGTARGVFGYADGNIFTAGTDNSISLRSENDLHLGGGGNNLQMTFDGTGVGIGTTSPASLFEVGLSAQTNEVNLSNILFINSTSGRVGIGTASPGNLLHVKATSGTARIEIENTAADSIATLKLLNDAQDWRIEVRGGNGDALSFFDNTGVSGSRMVITPDGNVGINATNPTDALHVDGNINITGCYELSNGTKIGGTCLSSLKYKKNIQNFEFDWNKFLGVTPKKWEWINATVKLGERIIIVNATTNKTEDVRVRLGTSGEGFITEEIAPFYPNRVDGDKIKYDISWMLENRKAIQDLKIENTLMKQSLCNLGERQWC